CRQPLAVESASGMCLSCVKALETSVPIGTPHSPLPGNPTPSQRELDDSTRSQPDFSGTARPDKAAEASTWSGEACARLAPAGYDLFRYLGGGGMGDVYL